MNNFPDFPDEKFRFVKQGETIQDAVFQTKQVGYFRDAMRRFKKNKSSVAAAVIILLLILFAVLTPLFATYDMGFTDPYYTFTRPKCTLLSGLGIWDGCSYRTVNQQTYDYYDAAGAGIKVKALCSNQ